MGFKNDNGETWDWQGSSNFLEDNLDVSKCLWTGANQEEDVSFLFDDQMTPIKDCGDFSYFANNCEEIKGLDKCEEPSIAKRSRMIQFDTEGLDTFGCEDVSFTVVRSKDRVNPVEKSLSELSNWVSGCEAEGTLSASGYESLDQPSEVWVASLFTEADTEMNPKDKIPSQIDIAEISKNQTVSAASNRRCPLRTQRNGFKGRESYMKNPVNLASSVAYPFAFIKPCTVIGDVTLKDINQRIRTPPPPSKLKQSEDNPACFPTSAFSGKPVVGTTMIRTEGGKGKIKILRTRG